MLSKSAKRLIQNYSNHVKEHLTQAFTMGYEDGKRGQMQELPPLPDPNKDRRVYVESALALLVYTDGYAVGSVEK